jgi:hypothetical protein
MPESEYEDYLAAIRSYVTSEKIRPFGPEHLVQTVVDQIINTEPSSRAPAG